jgi:hypothetical protein
MRCSHQRHVRGRVRSAVRSASPLPQIFGAAVQADVERPARTLRGSSSQQQISPLE